MWTIFTKNSGFALRNSAFIGATICLLVIVWGVAQWVAKTEFERQRQSAIHHAENASLMFKNFSEQTFHYADTYMRFARVEYSEKGLQTVNKLLRRIPLDQNIVSHITVIDKNGTPLLVSGRKIKPGCTAKDRAYFYSKNKAHRTKVMSRRRAAAGIRAKY